MSRDLVSNLAQVQLLDPQTINNTDTVSLILDTRGFESAAITLMTGTFTGVDADSTLLAVLQESDDTVGANFTPVAAADMQGAFTLINSTSVDNVRQTVGYIGNRRYIRVNLDFTTGTGGITAAPVAVLGLLSTANFMPVTAPAPITAS